MLRKSMIVLCAAASVVALTPNMALARGGGGGGGGGHGGGGGGFGGHAGGFSGGGFGGGGFAARGGNFGGANFAARGVSGGTFSNSFAHAPTSGNFNAAAVPGNRFASGNFGHGRFDHGFRHGRRFFVGGAYYDGYWDYPDYAYDDSYYDNGNCYIVQQRVHTSYGWRIRPVQVCG